MVNCQKIITERWPQIDLYFLSKPEVEKKTYSRGNVLRNFNMVCILSDVTKLTPIWPSVPPEHLVFVNTNTNL